MANNLELGINPSGNNEQKFREYKGDIDIFVPRDKEQEYLDKHGIEIRRLPNGITIFAATRRVEDNAYAKIELNFPSGAYHEQKGKSGINHLVEHLISNKPGTTAKRTEADYNARTNNAEIEVQIQGVANPNVRNYGLWPVIPVAMVELTQPLEVTQSGLESEKRVVVAEMRHYDTDHNELANRFFGEVVYSQRNPANYRTIGTEEDVRSITLDEVRKQHGEIFIPKGLDVSIFVEGNPNITSILLDQIQQGLYTMPRGEKKPMKVDENLYAEFNPDFKPDQVYAKDTGLNNELLTVYYVWLMSNTGYTVPAFATTRFLGLAEQKMFSFFRESGLGYSCNHFDAQLGDEHRLLGFSMTIPTRASSAEFATGIYPQFKTRVFGTFGHEDINYINDITHRRLEALPTTVAARFEGTKYGLKQYGRIIDSDRVPELHKMITPQHLEEALDYFTSVQPATILVGDLD